MASGPITSWQIDRKKIGKLEDFEALILWPPDVKSQFIGKDPDPGKD